MIIRRQPSDFVVEEVLVESFAMTPTPAPGGGAPHALYLLEKTSLTTPEAVQFFAAGIGIKSGAVAYAGLKDKHAETSQHVTTPMGVRTPELAPEAIEGRRWRARRLGWTPAPITADAIARNRFTIVVRDATAEECREMDRRSAILTVQGPQTHESGALAIVNYFGDQRFGSARHGQGFAATRIIRGDFEGALRLLIGTPARKDSGKRRALTRAAAGAWGDWPTVLASTPRCPERRAIETLAAGGSFRDAFAALPNLTQVLAVEAYQSWLWNAAARALVQGLDGDPLRAEDDFGEMLFAPAGRIPEPWWTMAAAMPAPEIVMDDAWGEAVTDVLHVEKLEPAMLRVPGLRRPAFGAAKRPLIVPAHHFQVSTPEPDDLGRPNRLKRTLRFVLPRGAYATVVLRALGQ